MCVEHFSFFRLLLSNDFCGQSSCDRLWVILLLGMTDNDINCYTITVNQVHGGLC